MLSFTVAEKYARGPEQIIAKFNKQEDAKLYIQNKLQRDADLKVAISYLLYDLGELVETFDQSNVENQSASAGGQQRGATQSFSPSPLQTSPRPTSMPPSSFRDNKDSDDEKKW